MKYGILSDIHGNFEALNVVLDYLGGESVEGYICCGDIVGYGPNPNECVEIVRDIENLHIVVGNHDWASLGLEDITTFRESARDAIKWTIEQLTDENKDYLKELPYCEERENFIVVHGSPRDPLDEYLLSEDTFKKNLKYFKKPLCFIGHSHIPLYFYISDEGCIGGDHINDGDQIYLNPLYRYVINCGSVGQPRDNNPLASFGIYDSQRNILTLKRLSYNIERIQQKMRAVHLPESLIDRLGMGV